jgi:hypothetical protein
MKIRTGFVSNSSSSSFVVFLLDEDYKKVCDGLSKLEMDILSKAHPQKVNAFGKQLVKVGYTSGNYSIFEDYSYDGILTEEEEEKLGYEGPDCIMDSIVEKLTKGDCLTDSQDF